MDPLNNHLLRLLYELIHDHAEACSRLTRFSEILAIQFYREQRKLVVKILKHMYKTADYLFKDRASVIHTEQGLC